ncbi:MAG: glutathione-disulfide reductase [Geminicoccaceae bacterium]
MAHFDLFVIGGGSGGVACARRAASYGARVGLAEASRLGGTCVIRGCVPKKLMHYGSHFGELLNIARDYGWSFGEVALDFERLLAARNAEIARLNGIYQRMLDEAGVTVMAGRATVGAVREGGGHAVEIGGERHTATNLVIATGAHASLPEVEGIEHCVTSDFMLEEIYPLPRRFAVVGAGYIGLEIASIVNGLGSETTMILRGEEPLRGFDDDLRASISRGLEQRGVRIRPRTKVERIEKRADGLRLHTNVGEVDADMVLYATGRAPKAHTDRLGLDELGVKRNAHGMIYVDATYSSNIRGIYAVGDCSDHAGNGIDGGQHDLTPVAIAEGRVIAETLFNDNPHTVRYDTIPTAIFSAPQAASVGLSEQLARSFGYDVRIFRTSFRPMMLSFSKSEQRIMMKLVVDRATDRVLGCHMVGDDAAETIQGLAVALTAGASKAQFDETVGIHPSAAEEFVTMYKPVDDTI